jgi:AcrR family transcriptional regulator
VTPSRTTAEARETRRGGEAKEVSGVNSAGLGPSRPMRADARHNHEQLLVAARDLFIEEGPEVPLEEIARSAGVGIATLYRRFADRPALTRAVLLEALSRTEHAARSARDTSASPFATLAEYMHAVLDLRTSALIPALLAELADDDSRLRQHREAIVAVVQDMIDDGHARGALRRDVTAADIGLLLVRLSRPLPGRLSKDVEMAYAHRHLDIVLAGLAAPDDESGLPGPTLTLAELRAARSDPA